MQSASTLKTIKDRKDFLAAAHGCKWVAGTLILQMHSRAAGHPAGTAPRIGYTVTRKIGGAVVRNRAKRRLREAVRMIAATHIREHTDYVVIARKGAATCEFSVLVRDMEFAFSRIHANKKPSS
ncbi:MAG: ribonuclease P protein component [Alphaproteobacteria bacterium]